MRKIILGVGFALVIANIVALVLFAMSVFGALGAEIDPFPIDTTISLESVPLRVFCPNGYKGVIVIPITAFDVGTVACALSATLRDPIK